MIKQFAYSIKSVLSMYKPQPTLMKQHLRFLPVAVFLLLFCSFTLSEASGDSAKISKKGFIVNGVKINSDWRTAPLLDQLGTPDSTYTGVNRLHIYKQKGIVIFEKLVNKQPSGIISEVQFFIDRTGNRFNLTSDYTGQFSIDKLKISTALSADLVKEKLKKWKKTESYLENNYRLSNYGIYIYFQFNASDSQLQKLSVGKDK